MEEIVEESVEEISTSDTLSELIIQEEKLHVYVQTQKCIITNLEIDLLSTLSTSNGVDKKYRRGLVITAQTNLNEYIRNCEKILSKKVFHRMFELENVKSPNGTIPDQYLDEIKGLYLLLSRQGRLNVRYLKLPKCWLSIGLYGGILEELIVILRTSKQIGLGSDHLYTVENIMNYIRSITLKQEEDIRFIFLTMLNEIYPEKDSKELTHLVVSAIHCQGDSKRIGVYIDHGGVNGGSVYVYAIQGIYGDIKYDDRVVLTISPKFELEAIHPLYAVHFTKEVVAYAIWQKEVIKSVRKRDQPLTPGSICKFDRAIHALTCIVKDDDGVFRINKAQTGIRDRMVHGINDDVSRPKYQAGLVIDLVKLSQMAPHGCVQINELGTLLVHTDIPHECIVELLSTDEQLASFWRLDN
jgi:hypothetical protein